MHFKVIHQANIEETIGNFGHFKLLTKITLGKVKGNLKQFTALLFYLSLNAAVLLKT